jgi:hypothetical protein
MKTMCLNPNGLKSERNNATIVAPACGHQWFSFCIYWLSERTLSRALPIPTRIQGV